MMNDGAMMNVSQTKETYAKSYISGNLEMVSHELNLNRNEIMYQGTAAILQNQVKT